MPTEPGPETLDTAYLDRQTFGDRALADELLSLFEAQCAHLVPLIVGPDGEGRRADAVHTLKGAARAIGAGRIADLAAAIERDAAGAGGQSGLPRLSALLVRAVEGIGDAIACRKGRGA